MAIKIKVHPVELGEREVWHFVYSYDKNVSSIISPLTNRDDVIDYFYNYCKYTLNRHFGASGMFTESEKHNIDALLDNGKRTEAYEYASKCSKLLLEDE